MKQAAYAIAVNEWDVESWACRHGWLQDGLGTVEVTRDPKRARRIPSYSDAVAVARGLRRSAPRGMRREVLVVRAP